MSEADILSLHEADSDPRWSANIEGSFGFPVTSVLAVPLEGESSPLGAIGLFSA